MENCLALLRRDNLIDEWHDTEIVAGQNIPCEVRAQMDDADIVAFLLSHDFLASEECMKEWDYVKKRETHEGTVYRVPIIVRPCPWIDLLSDDNIKALPKDGVAVSTYQNQDIAWTEVYDGVKHLVHHIRSTFTPRSEFLDAMQDTDFIGRERLTLSDLFVFPTLSFTDVQARDEHQVYKTVNTLDKLLEHRFSLVHGDDKSGKTALARSIHLALIDEGIPSLLVDLADISHRPRNTIFKRAYDHQFSGDFCFWLQQPKNTVILDNLTSDPRALQVIELATKRFHRIIVMTRTDELFAFFHDEDRLAHFTQFQIEPLNLADQEVLIKNQMLASRPERQITDGLVDQVEDHVDSVVISNSIVPRYPFYILSILQSRESYMPGNLSITSYGHCYQALIFANLIRSGVSNEDDKINACINFCE